MLVVVTAGGVQRFISEARTTADLGNGSVLYSLAMARVRDTLTSGGADVILPAPRRDYVGGLPNRVVAVLDGGGADLAAAAVDSAVRWWRSEAARVVGVEIAERVPTPAFGWVVVDGDDYAVAWETAHRALAARKRARRFGPCYREAWALCALSGREPAERSRPEAVRSASPREERLSAEGWFKRGLEGLAVGRGVGGAGGAFEVGVAVVVLGVVVMPPGLLAACVGVSALDLEVAVVVVPVVVAAWRRARPTRNSCCSRCCRCPTTIRTARCTTPTRWRSDLSGAPATSTSPPVSWNYASSSCAMTAWTPNPGRPH